uniref:Myosinlike protein putative n=1 Tax=Albugo laibachii Nc14 TaxID=890382 RepID=F0WAG4_9STRA|nr:myosinlike protein putative [Albugo laibachii Nc14]|eukprot:CCA18135.1 myosinlike protein putative [Albugo laibachii Nc14]
MTISTLRQSRIQAAIDECARNVRVYQQKMKNGDPEFTMDIIQEQIQTMIRLRKELKTINNQEVESDTSSKAMSYQESENQDNQEAEWNGPDKSAEDRVNVMDSWVLQTDSKLDNIEKSIKKVEQSRSNANMLMSRRNTTTYVNEACRVERKHVQADESSKALSDRASTLIASNRKDAENGQNGKSEGITQLTAGELGENALYLNETQKLRDELTQLRATLEETDNKSFEIEREFSCTKRLLLKEQERFRDAESDRKKLHVEMSTLRECISRLEAEKLNLEALVDGKTCELAGLKTDLKKSFQASSAAQLENEKRFGLVRESERRLEEECFRLRTEITEMTRSNTANGHIVETLEKQLGETQEVLTLANAAKEDVQDKLATLHKQKLVEMSEKEKALERARTAESSLKLVSTELHTVKAHLCSMEDTHKVSSRKHASIETELGDLRKKVTAQELMLKKSGVSLHEANEELKEARANVQKHKTLVQSTKQTACDKTSEMDRIRKQLTRVQTELASAVSNNRDNARNSQQAKETIKSLRQELRQAREEVIALTTKNSNLESTSSKLADDLKTKVNSNAQLSKEVEELKHYRTALSVVILVFTSVLLCSIMK